MAADPSSILVRAPNWLGDLVMATPGLRALRLRFPHAHIAVQLPAPLVPLLEGAPWFDALLPLDARAHTPLALWREARALRAREPFELGLCLPDSFSSALRMRLGGVRRVVGYRRGGRGGLLHQPVTPPPEWGRRRMVARERFVLGLVEAVGVAPGASTALELHVAAEQRARADALFERLGLDAEAPRVVLAPGASYGPSKCWPAASFAAVGDALARQGYRIAVAGAPGESALVAQVCSAMRSSATPLVGAEIDLGVLKVLLRDARAVVANDAGARHVAVAFGVPCVVVMGPTSPAKTDLNLERVAVLRADDVACSPCYERVCPIDHRCMTRVGPARALAALEAFGLRGAAA